MRKIALEVPDLDARVQNLLSSLAITDAPESSVSDGDLATIDAVARECAETTGRLQYLAPNAVRRVVAALRRVRSEAWLATAAEEIAGSANPDEWQANLGILRKHRDRQA
jgi:NAD(P)-dependent dehydrogenase (short-subunit alcohol dehydrogenase family)